MATMLPTMSRQSMGKSGIARVVWCTATLEFFATWPVLHVPLSSEALPPPAVPVGGTPPAEEPSIPSLTQAAFAVPAA
jgi:hypothetical protein